MLANSKPILICGILFTLEVFHTLCFSLNLFGWMITNRHMPVSKVAAIPHRVILRDYSAQISGGPDPKEGPWLLTRWRWVILARCWKLRIHLLTCVGNMIRKKIIWSAYGLEKGGTSTGSAKQRRRGIRCHAITFHKIKKSRRELPRHHSAK